MFDIERVQKDGFNQVILKDVSAQTAVAVIPDCGAMLRSFIVKEGYKLVNVIDGFSSREEYDTKVIERGFKGLKLSPFPGRIPEGRYDFNNQVYRINPSLQKGVVIHGLLYNRPFEIIQERITDEGAHISILHKYAGDDAGYPFPYDCRVEYSLRRKNTLSITTTVKNTGNSILPVADGWHPYFSFGGKVDDLELQFCAGDVLEFEHLVPTGKILQNNSFFSPERIDKAVLDNSFVLDFSKPQPMCVLRDTSSGWQLEFYPDKSYPYLQIYIPPHRNSIAIENLSAPPNAFNNGIGLITLAPGEEIRFFVDYVLRKK
ncbi:MAG: aldose 1-epimerase [Chitinophagaceae bacterium]|nr:aldose 1-epimerase [Chitinophagaceae bacterium]